MSSFNGELNSTSYQAPLNNECSSANCTSWISSKGIKGKFYVVSRVKKLVRFFQESKKLKLVDCTFSFAIGQKPDYKRFQDTYYGRFEELLRQNSKYVRLFVSDLC